ncbi:ComEC/Rec2 family competence protein [Clostridium sp. LY3-2]|uniref:ComEC/Rec2 family competence protein n=1 Tax=Clostridium sp. LY3-2 TaxID=2942482 RepID=UPI0021530FEB|nr:ComEC/Rec2 family competence protein [Clostridium sp. LY3-2]MCR6513512.1 ComEC/Rec2 family competence protein [Clostridium sp. LY3-2]
MFKTLNNTKAPIIYIGVSFLFSSILYLFLNVDIFYGFIFSLVFFLFIYLKEGFGFLILISLFVIFGLFINYNFYNFELKPLEIAKIEKIYSYGGISEIRGRKVYLSGDLKDFKPLEKVILKGEFTKNIDIEKGLVGEIKVLSIKSQKSILNKINDFKIEFVEKLKESIGDREGSLVNSILFGDKSGLDEEDKENMKKYGVVHVISVSGLHIGLIYLIFKKLFKEYIGLLICFFYCVITGFAFSSIRAFIMIFILSLGLKLRKSSNSKAALALSAIIIFLIKPYSIFDLGFILSFLATLSIILFYKPLRKKLYKIGGWLGDTIAISLSAQVLVMPILIFYFNEFSIMFLVGNIILVPLINLILVLGFLGFILFKISVISNIINFILGTTIYLLDYLIEILDKFSLDIIFLNEKYAIFYVSLLISFYFYKRGIKKIIVLPLATILFIGINLYSFYPKIINLKEGLLVRYKGDSVILLKDKVDYKRAVSVFKPRDIYKEFEKTYIKEDCTLVRNGENFILDLGDREFTLLLKDLKRESSYDIINFEKEKIREIMIFKDYIIDLR